MERKNQPDGMGNNSSATLEDAKGLASQVADQAKGFVGDQVQGQQAKGADHLGQVAKALHEASENLADSPAAPYVQKAADALERVSGSFRNANLKDIARTTERFAHDNPVMFIGGAFVLGLFAARFLKSTTPDTGSSYRLSEGTGPASRDTDRFAMDDLTTDRITRQPRSVQPYVSPSPMPSDTRGDSGEFRSRSRMGSSPPPTPSQGIGDLGGSTRTPNGRGPDGR